MVVTLDSHAGVRGSNPVATKLFFFFFFFFFSIHVRNIFYPFITTLKLHISYKISLVSPNCYFFYILFIFSPTVSKRIFINEMEMMLSCYSSMLVILNLLNRFATFRMWTSDNVQGQIYFWLWFCCQAKTFRWLSCTKYHLRCKVKCANWK